MFNSLNKWVNIQVSSLENNLQSLNVQVITFKNIFASNSLNNIEGFSNSILILNFCQNLKSLRREDMVHISLTKENVNSSL